MPPIPSASAPVLGHGHPRVRDLDRAISFCRGMIGLEVTQLYGDQAAFLASAGGHHPLGLNTWGSRGGAPAPPGHPGLFHTAFLYPDRPSLAAAIRRALDPGVAPSGAAERGVSEAVCFDDPEGDGVDLCRDRPPRGTGRATRRAASPWATRRATWRRCWPKRRGRGWTLPPAGPRLALRTREAPMAMGSNIRTYFQGRWHEGDVPVMRAADHGTWLGTSVFDGARYADGLAPDLDLHCARVNRSAEALMIAPTVTPEEMVEIVWEGLRLYPDGAAVYVRPMYWSIDSAYLGVLPETGPTGFAICLEEVPMPAADATTTLATTQFRRPVLADNVCNAKAGCLYPNNARMLAEARARGYGNALVADAMGNVAESATANVFMVRDGVVFTPIPNGTFLAGITRARHIANLRADGVEVVECVLSFDDFRAADEVFLTGNLSKVTPVTEFDGTRYAAGPVARRARDLYWDWAHSTAAAA